MRRPENADVGQAREEHKYMNQLNIISKWPNDLDSVDEVHISPDTKIMVTRHGHALGIWEIPAGKRIAKIVFDDPECHDNHMGGMAVDFATRRIACWNGPTTPGGRFLRLVDLTSGRTIRSRQVDRNIKSASFDPSGKYIITGEWKGFGEPRPRVRVWSADTIEELHSFEGHSGDIDHVSISPNGALLATACYYRNYPRTDDLYIWDLTEMKLKLKLDAPEGNFRGLYWSSDSNRLTCLYTSQIALWTVNGSANTVEIGGELDSVSCCDKYAAFVHKSYEGTVELKCFSIWDLTTICSIAKTVPQALHQYLSFRNPSPNGAMLICIDSEKKPLLWDTMSGLPLLQISEMRPIAFSPNSDFILAAGENTLAMLRCPTDEDKDAMLVEPRRVENEMQQQRAEKTRRDKEAKEEELRKEAETKRLAEEEQKRISKEAEEKRRVTEEQRIRKETEEKEQKRIEEIRREGVKTRRKSNGQCIMCGSALGLLHKLVGKEQHSQCTRFKE